MRDNTESYHVAPRLHVNPFPCSCPSAFLSQIHSQMYTHNQLCVFLVSHFLPHMPPPPLSSLFCTLWQLCWWWLCAHGASWLRGPRWPTWQLLMFRCSTPLTQRPWSNTHMHTGLQINIEAQCTCMFTLCGYSHAYTEVCILPHVAEEVHFNKEKQTGRFYTYSSRKQQLSVWQRKNKERMTVLFVHDFFSIYDCFFVQDSQH